MSRTAPLIGAVAVLLVMATLVFGANASMISYNVNFTAEGFEAGDPVVTGSLPSPSIRHNLTPTRRAA